MSFALNPHHCALPRRISLRLPAAVYLWRRAAAISLLVLMLIVAFLGVRTVLADRGAVPASSPAIRLTIASSASTGVSVAQPGSYIVQPGDTLWSIGQHFHGSVDVADYVDRLVASHGATSLDIGDVIVLP